MRWVGSVASLVLALWLGVDQTAGGDQESCGDDGEDSCPLLQPGIAGAGLPLYVGLQPQGDGWVYNLTFQHDKDTHVRFILRQTDGIVQGEIDFGEYSEKSRIIRWPKDYFPLCGWRYFLIQEEDDRLQVLYENTTLERTDTIGYVLPYVESNFVATKVKVRVNCDHRPLGGTPATTTTRPGMMDNRVTPHDHTESTVSSHELPKASLNITVYADDGKSASTLTVDVENTPDFAVDNESTSVLTRDEHSAFVLPLDDDSFTLYPPDNESISKYPKADDLGEETTGVSKESDVSETLPVPSPPPSEASHPHNHTGAPTEASDELYITSGNNGNTSMLPTSNGSSPELTVHTVKVDEERNFEDTNCSENCTVNPRQSAALPSESPHQQHYTIPSKTTTSPEPHAATTGRAAYKGRESSDVDTTGSPDIKKDNTVGIVVATVIIVCLSVCGALCVLYWRRKGSTAITRNTNSREYAGGPETIALRQE